MYKRIRNYFSDARRTERLNRETVRILRKAANRRRPQTTMHNVITEGD